MLFSLLGTISVAFFINNNMEKFLVVAIVDIALTLLLVSVFVLFNIKEKNTIKKYLGKKRMSFKGEIRLNGKDTFEAFLYFYDNGIRIAEKGNELIPFLYDNDSKIITNKDSITFTIKKLGKVELLPEKS